MSEEKLEFLPEPDLPLDKFPEIRRLKASTRMFRGFFDLFAQATYEAVGKEKFFEIGSRFGKKMVTAEHIQRGREHYGIEGDGPEAMIAWEILGCRRILEAGYFNDRKVDVIRHSPKKYSIRFHPPCPLFRPRNDQEAIWTPKGFCREAYCDYDRAVTKAINPKMELTCGEMLDEGGPYCELIWELKD